MPPLEPRSAEAAFELLPSIDLRQGRVVRLHQGDDAQRTDYGGNPLAVLDRYAAAGVRTVHVVDLDAAFGETPQRESMAALVKGAREAGLGIQWGGGLRDGRAVEEALAAGCGRVVIGSLVGREPEAFAALARQHPGRLVPALDVGGADDDEVRLDGWRTAADRSLAELCASLSGLPCPGVLVTVISRDGTLAGPALERTRRVAEATGLPAFISGGVSSLGDLAAARAVPGIGGAVVGKALFEGRFTVQQALAVCRGEEVAR
ncbi:MAG: HisA/HisF-related TIM barrel protein [Acidobacteriota bacterium]